MPEGGGGGSSGGAGAASPSQPSTLPVTQLDKSLTVSVTPCMAHSSVNEHCTSLDSFFREGSLTTKRIRGAMNQHLIIMLVGGSCPRDAHLVFRTPRLASLSLSPPSCCWSLVPWRSCLTSHLTACLTTHAFLASYVILTLGTHMLHLTSHSHLTPHAIHLTPPVLLTPHAFRPANASLLPSYLCLTPLVLLTPHASRPTYTSRLPSYLHLTPPVLLKPHASRPTYTSRLPTYLHFTPPVLLKPHALLPPHQVALH
ncbi:hypothetical protein Pcinc_041843 [Petrolisthes cinctipes]|uniref:Uncharacterized protein n=1 Tax=Petrolisthes cinctipes TaxID=88211 RepID=A0AAE1EJE6_PETCI|nr:hypothetical protein Pcinc_041843 [Petrolisthes cinctipes]